MAKSNKASVNRRGFLKGAAASAAAGAAALVTNVETSEAQRGGAAAGQGAGAGAGAAPWETIVKPSEARRGGAAGGGGAGAGGGAAPPQSANGVARDAEKVPPPAATARAVTRPGSDLMTQVLKDLGVEYVAANPGS